MAGTATIGKSVRPITITKLSGVGVNASADTMCTVGTGEIVTIKYIKATNTDTITSYFCLGVTDSTAANRYVDQVAIAANSEYERWVNWVFKAAAVICASASVTAKVNVIMTGTSELTP